MPVEGFNPTRLKAFKEGIEKTIGAKVLSAVIFDKDYRSESEINSEKKELEKINYFVHIHSCKELENFLIVSSAIQKAVIEKISENNKRQNKNDSFNEDINTLLSLVSDEFKHKTQAQLQTHQRQFEKSKDPKAQESTIIEKILKDFEKNWDNLELRFKMIPGKDFLSSLNTYLQNNYSISITHGNIINHLQKTTVPEELKMLIDEIDNFRKAVNN